MSNRRRDPVDRADAVLYPLLSTAAMQAIAAVSLALIIALPWLLPADLDSCSRSCDLLGGLRDVARSLAAVAYFEKSSHFPLVTAITYFTTLLLGVVGGLCLACTRIPTLNLAAIGSGWLGGALLRFGAYGLWVAQFVVTPMINDNRRLYRYLQLISTEKAALIAFMALMYLASMLIVFGLAADLLYPLIRRRMK